MPWRNGLGVTVEIIKQDLKDNDGFAWRLSMADVTEDGDFSNFSGYDRTLVLLEGNGMTLNCNGKKHCLSQTLQYAEFRGDDPTYATLHDGPIKDFNIMTHRDYCSAKVGTGLQTGQISIGQTVSNLLIYAVEKELLIESSEFNSFKIPARHLMVIDNPSAGQIRFNGKMIAVRIANR